MLADHIVLYYHNQTNKEINLSKDEVFIKRINDYESTPDTDPESTIRDFEKRRITELLKTTKSIVIKPNHIGIIKINASGRLYTLTDVYQYKEGTIPIYCHDNASYEERTFE